VKRPIDTTLDFGLVRVKCGKHKGKVGYFDDDKFGSGIVYWGMPWMSDYAVIPIRWLENVTAMEASHAGWCCEEKQGEAS